MFKSLLRRLAPILAVVFLMLSTSAGTHAQTGDDLAALRKQVSVLISAGRHAEALPLAERALKLAEEQHGPDNPKSSRNC